MSSWDRRILLSSQKLYHVTDVFLCVDVKGIRGNLNDKKYHTLIHKNEFKGIKGCCGRG